MNFLFDNPLANLYGPYFLIFYGFLIISTIIGFRIFRNRLDRTAHLIVPPIPSSPDAFEIAYLRGGENELARTTVFALAQKNLLEFVNDDKIQQIHPTGAAFDKRSLSPIEHAALNWFNSSRDVKDLFQNDGLANALRPFGETYRARLEMRHLINDEETRKRSRQMTLQAFAVFGAVGAYKFVAAIYHGRWNVSGIVIITLIGMFVLGIAAKMPRLTKLGKIYLERLQIAFERVKPTNHNPLKSAANDSAATFAAVDPFLISVGVFGGAALAGTIYNDYNLAFQKAQNHSAGSSCGSGCGSASSCSSGDGGSGCGGGCGGCGG